jgi:hypothetical protein
MIVPFALTFFRHPDEVLGAKRRASKDDGPGTSAGILRGPLRGHLRMTVNDERSLRLSVREPAAGFGGGEQVGERSGAIRRRDLGHRGIPLSKRE